MNGDAVRPGFWLVRARLGPGKWGPAAPAAIIVLQTRFEPGEPENEMERSPFYAGFVSGLPVSIWSIHQATHTEGDRILRIERVLHRVEYDRLMAQIAEARRADRYLPMAVPFKPVSRRHVEIPFAAPRR